jgi:hypothetical protein
MKKHERHRQADSLGQSQLADGKVNIVQPYFGKRTRWPVCDKGTRTIQSAGASAKARNRPVTLARPGSKG